ncbi:DUF3263 domain-containing protein [Isoptericola sp. NEAU-Y5]|uniref:DUF3263 domain-containing protein n=1 Tax=Isoptericola luteus TaxID=2879484 RepID=A0ABS7ZDB6_9MICO|nr:DUF3263 domain-containing protein [Isoptericola sp. NEAU-Y5]MCA5893035.1 DUF3263 domain-containing protein [Isoptericola sp. NEAU-Y5]
MSEMLVQEVQPDPEATSSSTTAGERADAPEVALTDREREILAFERQWWKYAGAKEQAVRELFDMSATRYYQVLNALIDSPAALEHDPMLVKRLRRMRSTRQRARSARRLSDDRS